MLSHAVEGAEAPDEVAAVDGDDGAVFELVFEDGEGAGVVGIIEDGDEDCSIGDVEVGVAGGEALAFEVNGLGEWKFDDVEGFVAGVGHFGEAFGVFFHRGEVVVGFIVLNAGDDGAGVDEAGGVIDVAVGVVAGDAAVEPEDLGGTEEFAEGLFDVGAGEVGVALLDGGEEAFFGGEDAGVFEAAAADVDGAAFEDEALELSGIVLAVGDEAGEVEGFGHELRDGVIEGVVVVLGPGVEFEVGEGAATEVIFEEDAAAVTGPDAVGGGLVEGDVGEVDVIALEKGADVFLGGGTFFGRVDEDVDAFALGEEADDFGVDPGDGFELVGPVFMVVGPGDPGGFMGFPLGGHGEAAGGGGMVGDDFGGGSFFMRGHGGLLERGDFAEGIVRRGAAGGNVRAGILGDHYRNIRAEG